MVDAGGAKDIGYNLKNGEPIINLLCIGWRKLNKKIKKN